MKSCKICGESDPNKLVFQYSNGKMYIKNMCKKDYNRIKKERNMEMEKSSLRKEYINCVITENNKKYDTTNLSKSDVEELKRSGYTFIFK